MDNKYNPDLHHRQSIRLREYDYSSAGLYFVTICTREKECHFGKYPYLENIVDRRWQDIPNCYPNVQLDEYIIMPNHVHGIIVLNDTVGAALAAAQNVDVNKKAGVKLGRAGVKPAPTLGTIIGEFKSLCVNEWLKYIKQNDIDTYGKFWQRNYYEHIIRNDKELNGIREYIINNPMEWEEDEDNSLKFKNISNGKS